MVSGQGRTLQTEEIANAKPWGQKGLGELEASRGVRTE